MFARIARAEFWLAALAVGSGLIGLAVQRVLGDSLGRPLAGTHAVGLLFGGLVAVVVSRLPAEQILRHSYWIHAIGLASLVACFLPGLQYPVSGTSRWIDLPLFVMSPGPIAVVSLVPVLARAFGRHASPPEGLGRLLPFLISPVPILFLLLAQPDLSLVIVTWFLVVALFAVEWPGRVLGSLAGACFGAVTLLVPVVLTSSYRVQRLLVFLDPHVDPTGAGFVATQTRALLARAGPFGQGHLGGGRPGILPEIHSDNVVVAVGVLAGVPGIVLVILPLVFLVLLAGDASLRAASPERRRIVLGVAFLFGFQMLTNLAVVAGVVPANYQLLPFMSAGPSALLAQGAAVGLLLSALSTGAESGLGRSRGSGQTVSSR